MALIASNLIESARNQHPLFDPRLIPTKVALDRLSREQRAVLRRIASVHPEAVEALVTIAATDFDTQAEIDAGITLDAAIWREGRKAEWSNGTTDFYIVDSTDDGNPDLWPSGYMSGDKLFLIGSAEVYAECDSITYAHVLLPAALDDVDDTLTVPDEVEAYLVADLALFMARRVQGRPGAPGIGTFADERNEALDDLLVTIANRKTGTVHSIQSID